MANRSVALARVEVLTAALLFSTGGAAIKLCSLTSWQVAAGRSALAALVLVAYRPKLARFPSLGELAVSFCYAGMILLFVLANKATTAASAIFLQYTSPVYAMVGGALLLGERPRRSQLLALIPMAAGLFMCLSAVEAASSTAPAPALGRVLALGAGMFWGATVVGLRWLKRSGGGMDPLAAPFWGNVLAALVALPIALPLVGEVTAGDVAALGWLGAFQVAAAYVLLAKGLELVTAAAASLLLLVEPVLNPFWAWLASGESPSLLTLAGGALLVSAAALGSVGGADDDT